MRYEPPMTRVHVSSYKGVYSEFAGGNLIVEAMNADAVDLGSWSEIPTAFAAAAHANVRAIAVLRGDVNTQVVLVPKGSTAKTIADLKGKRVSYGYPIYFARAQDGARVLKTALGVLSGNYHLGARPTVLNDTPMRAAIADYLHRLQRAYDWTEAHKAEWSTILSGTIGVLPRFVRAALDGESQPPRLAALDAAAIASWQDVADVFAAGHTLPAHVDVAPYFDTPFNTSLARI